MVFTLDKLENQNKIFSVILERKKNIHRDNLCHTLYLLISACVKNFEAIGGNCYLHVTAYENFEDAVKHCAGKSAILAEPRTNDEQKQLGKRCKDKNDHCFIGLVKDANNKYVWQSDKTEPIVTSWDTGEPDHEVGECIYYKNSKWTTGRCYLYFKFFCQMIKGKH